MERCKICNNLLSVHINGTESKNNEVVYYCLDCDSFYIKKNSDKNLIELIEIQKDFVYNIK